MNNIEKEFVPYAEALALKEIGFVEPCLGFYVKNQPKLNIGFIKNDRIYNENSNGNSLVGYGKSLIYASTFSQAFRWFREKYGLNAISPTRIYKTNIYQSRIINWNTWDEIYVNQGDFYEEAELNCLRKLIGIVKENK